jgi:xylulose-5-phosphate/fructose-6-phosphate phosphoketolase
MVDQISVGMKLHAKYSDGEFYPAEVVSVSTSAKRTKAPVKINFTGYAEEQWVSLKDLKSKALKGVLTEEGDKKKVLSADDVKALEGYWRASNFLTVGQIYLRGKNPLLSQPLTSCDIKARLLGHWGTCPGLNFVYTHLNRLVCRDNLSMCYVAGPGHGGPGIVAHTYLEGTYTKVYPKATQDTEGMGYLFKQFSWPRGIPSHVSPDCPGSFHEGGELGYSLLHSFGAVFDNKDLLVTCVIGDGECETGPVATSWHSGKFINPVTDGAVLPVVHLNGARIGSATLFSRMPRGQLVKLFEGYGYTVHFVGGDYKNHTAMHQKMASVLETCLGEIKSIQQKARAGKLKEAPQWPMIILQTPKGWTGPETLDGQIVEGTFRAHQVPASGAATNDTHLKALEAWMKSYKPEELFDSAGALKEEFTKFVPKPELAMGQNPHTNGGLLLKDLKLPELAAYEWPTTHGCSGECTAVLSKWLRDVIKENPTNFRIMCPDEITSNKMSAVFETTGRNGGYVVKNKKLDSPFDAPDGRVMEILSEHCCEGWLEGYLLTGRHGLFPCYEAFTSVVDSMINQHCKWLKATSELDWRKELASLNFILTSHTWRQDHNGYSHQVTGFIDNAVHKPGTVINIFLPADANTLLAVGKQCMASKHRVNVMIAGKHPMPQWLTLAEAEKHVAKGIDVWPWAGTETPGSGCDVVLACAGDVPTLETLAAAMIMRERCPKVKVRVVNVVDLMMLSAPGPGACRHDHAMSEERFEELFGTDTPVVMFFHGSPSTVRGLIYRRRSSANRRFSVKGFIECGSTTTPFDMTVFNESSRYDLVIRALERLVGTTTQRKSWGETDAPDKDPMASEYGTLLKELDAKLKEHKEYVWEHGEDMPEIKNWVWKDK